MRSNIASIKPDRAKLDAAMASMRAWLVALAIWLDRLASASRLPLLRALAEAALKRFGPHIRADLRASVTELERLLFVRALERVRFSQPRRARGGPPGAISRIPARVLIRAAMPSEFKALKTGPLAERARLLRLVLDNPEPFIALIAARLHKVCGRFRVLKPAPPLVTQPAASLAAAPVFACASADTS